MNKILTYIALLVSSVCANAQVEMADDFRGEGKIYVVVAVIVLILTGFFFLLFKLDRRTRRLEKEVKQNEK